jgi:pantothenate kinase type III
VLLALDAGNSNITIGAFEGRNLVFQWRLRTVHEQTADEWGILLHNLFARPAWISKVDGIIISSVVPPIDSTLAFMADATSTRSHVRGAAHRYRARPSATTTPTKWAPTAWSTASPVSTSTAARA